MKINLHTKNNSWALICTDKLIKIQLGPIRIYLSTVNLKPKTPSARRTSFRRLILERDGCKCQHCGKELKMSTLSLHHIKPVAQYPDLVYDADNCTALCKDCHIKLHQIQNRVEASMRNMVSVNPCGLTAADLAQMSLLRTMN